MIVGIGLGVCATLAVVGAALLFMRGETLPPDINTPEQPTAEVQSPDPVVEPTAEPKDEFVAEPSRPAQVAEKKKERAVPPLRDLQETKGAQETKNTFHYQYQWHVGQTHDYHFEIVVNGIPSKKTVKGNCTYTVGQVVNQPTEEELTATGTGFFVSSEGYLVTCAHVVEDAAQVKVVLGDQQWLGKVVAMDTVQDLAVVKVEAQDLPTLMLAEAEEVELAAPVRVVGFPLANMLGKGIKITSGTIAGRIEKEEGSHSFQVDATMNPGNSGGPIIDGEGHVVGVASALLSGLRISEVGFGVPAEQVRRLLQRAKISPTAVVQPNPSLRVVPS